MTGKRKSSSQIEDSDHSRPSSVSETSPLMSALLKVASTTTVKKSGGPPPVTPLNKEPNTKSSSLLAPSKTKEESKLSQKLIAGINSTHLS
jgi:hypothetical protein